MGVECSSAQLFRTGLVHADPHEGNMMYTDDGKLAMLDFGLICRVNNDQQEAMAGEARQVETYLNIEQYRMVRCLMEASDWYLVEWYYVAWFHVELYEQLLTWMTLGL